jgi:16S rRNA pseudouridine516 synthase
MRRLDQLLSSLGYGSRKEAQAMCDQGRVQLGAEILDDASRRVDPALVRLDEAPLDFPDGLLVMMHTPLGLVCTHDAREGPRVYDLLPERWQRRDPKVTSIGRLDKDTTGLLLLTDDGKLLHRIIHPKSGCLKVYHATLDRPMVGGEAALFASGTLQLQGETKPLLPAPLEVLGPNEALITLHEGRYHQVRRMFAAAGNHVLTLKRISIGGLKLPADLPEGEWRILTPEELAAVFR